MSTSGSAVSAHEIVRTHYCKQPGCTNEARSPVGRYSYCALHQAARAERTARAEASATITAELGALRALAKVADKARASAAKSDAAADAARERADAAERRYRDALRKAVG